MAKMSDGMISNENTGTDSLPGAKGVSLDSFCAEMQGNHRKAVIHHDNTQK